MRLSRFLLNPFSLATKIAILLAIFVACPAIIYVVLRDADAEKNALIVQSVQDQGQVIARSLAPLLRRTGEAGAPDLQSELQRLSVGKLRVKILFRRAKAERPDSYLYVAALPPAPGAYLALEYKEIIRWRILDKLGDTCEGYNPLAVHFTNPAGETELLSSMTPVHTAAGCWVILTSYPPTGVTGTAIGQPYWKRPEIQLAAVIYFAMAVLVVILFLTVWRSLQRFGSLAQTIRQDPDSGGSFAQLNRVPELKEVADEFDLMVGSLVKSEKAMQEAAEENAHAFKTPLAVITQSVEPLKRKLSEEDASAKRAIVLIERAVSRLDSLVGAARRMDHTMADLVNPPRERVDLTRLLTRMLESYGDAAGIRGVALSQDIAPDIHVRAGEDLLETVFENILDNALDYSGRGAKIFTCLSHCDGTAKVSVTDQGPGVDPRNLERIFDRYFSDRPKPTGDDNGEGGNGYYGIGLWIARRNIEAVGGEVTAENAPGKGLTITVQLPIDG